MKVLLTPFSPNSGVVGGIEIFSHYLTKAFPDLLMITNDDISRTASQLSAFLERKALGLIPYAFFASGSLLKILKKEEVDVVFVNGYYGWYLALKKIRVPSIVIFHGCNAGLADYTLRNYKKILYCYYRYYYGLFDYLSSKGKSAVVSVSPMVKDLLKRYYGVDSVVIPNGVDTVHFRPLNKKHARKALSLPLNKKIILSVGVSYTKGFHTLVELARRQKDMLFLVVSQSRMQRIPQNMQIRSCVPNSQMPIFYSAADCFTFPSKFEGCSIAPLEAMACNLPIVSSETGTFFKMAYDQPFGHVLPLYFTERDYEKAMLDVINESNLNPRAFVERHFSLEIFIEKYRNLLKKVLSN